MTRERVCCQKDGDPRLADVLDGLSNTIIYAESAGRPYVYRKGNKRIGTSLLTNRVNAGGWSRPASDFSVDGSSIDGATLVGPCPLNCTNGEDIGSATFPYPYLRIGRHGRSFRISSRRRSIRLGGWLRAVELLVLYFTLPAMAGWVVKDRMPDILREQFGLGQGRAGVSAVLYVQIASLIGVSIGG